MAFANLTNLNSTTMKTTRILGLFALLLIVAVTSCRKTEVTDVKVFEPEVDVPPPPPSFDPLPGNIHEILGSLAEPIQNLSISNDWWDQIVGAKGTIIKFPANTFVTLSGAPVSGTVDIELIEILNKSEMILSNKATMSTGGLLVSGGELFVNAKQGGSQLKFAPGKSADVVLPTDPAPPAMDLFVGSNEADVADLVWTPVTTPVTVGFDSASFSTDNYKFQIDSCQWINCDFFRNDPAPRTGVNIALSSDHSQENTAVYISVDGENAVANLYSFAGNTFSTPSFSYFPIGTAVTIIVISDFDGDMHAAFISTTIVAGHTENVTVSAITLADLQSQLNNLP